MLGTRKILGCIWEKILKGVLGVIERYIVVVSERYRGGGILGVQNDTTKG